MYFSHDYLIFAFHDSFMTVNLNKKHQSDWSESSEYTQRDFKGCIVTIVCCPARGTAVLVVCVEFTVAWAACKETWVELAAAWVGTGKVLGMHPDDGFLFTSPDSTFLLKAEALGSGRDNLDFLATGSYEWIDQ